MAPKRFEDALARLEKIVEKLEEGNLALDDSLEMFEEGVSLVKFCNSKLNEIEKKVKVLVKDQDKELIEKDFDPDIEEEAEAAPELEKKAGAKPRKKKAKNNKAQEGLL